MKVFDKDFLGVYNRIKSNFLLFNSKTNSHEEENREKSPGWQKHMLHQRII